MSRTIFDSFFELTDFIGVGIANGTGLDANTFDGLNTFADIANDQPAMNAIANEQRAIKPLATSQPAMQEVASSQTAMQEVASSQTAMGEVVASQTAMDEVRNVPSADSTLHLSDNYAATLDAFAGINTGVTGGIDDIAASSTAMQEVAASQTAMQEVAASQAAMQEVAASQAAMQEVGLSQTAQTEILDSNTAVTVLNNESTSFDADFSGNRNEDVREVIPETDESYVVYIKEADYTGADAQSDNVANFGWYDTDDNYLGETINEVFVDTLGIGWDKTGTANNRDVPLTGDIEAVIFP